MKEGIVVAGAATGAVVPLILREYVDKPTAVRAGFEWKTPSCLVGLLGGGALTLLGLFGRRWIGDTLSTFASAAGPAMMVTGIYSGLFPKTAPTPTPTSAPALRITTPPTPVATTVAKTY